MKMTARSCLRCNSGQEERAVLVSLIPVVRSSSIAKACSQSRLHSTLPWGLQLPCLTLYLRLVNLTRRTVLSAISAAAVVKAQRQPPPNWKPRLGVLCSYSDANLEFVKSEGFTSMQLRLDLDKLDDAGDRVY